MDYSADPGQIPETNDQKRARALARLSEPDAAGLSDRALARELNVSQPFVSGLRKALTSAPGDNDEGGDNADPLGAGEATRETARSEHQTLVSAAARGAGSLAELSAPMTPTEAVRAGQTGPARARVTHLTNRAPAAAVEGADEPDAARVLAKLADEETVARGRLEHLRGEHARVADLVIRGTATHDELDAVTRGIFELEQRLGTLQVLHERAEVLRRDQAARARRGAVDRALEAFDATEQEMRRRGEAFDRLASEFAALVADTIGTLDGARRAVIDAGEDLDPRLGAALELELPNGGERLRARIELRLRALALIPLGDTLFAEDRAKTIASALGAWSRFGRIARQHVETAGRPRDESREGLIEQLAGRAAVRDDAS